MLAGVKSFVHVSISYACDIFLVEVAQGLFGVNLMYTYVSSVLTLAL
jgi:hypothetical protein